METVNQAMEAIKQAYNLGALKTNEESIVQLQNQFPVSIVNGGTGGTTAAQARANLGAVATGSYLPSGDDSTLAYWQTIPSGIYQCEPNTLTHQPSSYGLVFVERNTNNIFVTWKTEASGAWYKKSMNNGSITGWELVYTAGSTIPISDGGTGATSAAGALSNLGVVAAVQSATNLRYVMGGILGATGNNTWTSWNINYGITFTYKPIVMVTPNALQSSENVSAINRTTSGCSIYMYTPSTSFYYVCQFMVFATAGALAVGS